MSHKRIIILFLFAFVIAACSAPAATAPVVETLPPSPTSLPSQTPLPSPTPIPPTATPVPLERAQYTLDVLLDYLAHRVDVEQVIVYPNLTGEPLDNLVLAVVSNYWLGTFNLAAASVDEVVVTPALDGQRMEIALPMPLDPGHEVVIRLKYNLALPEIVQGDPNDVRPRIFGWNARQTNLTNWYPFVVPYQTGTGWVLHDPWYFGEHLVYEAADYTVNLKFVDPAAAPLVAASGMETRTENGFTYTLEAGRAFVLSASDQYIVREQDAGGVTVRSYFFPLYETAGQAVLNATARAVQIYSQKFGPYPHKTLAAVQGDFNDGMEYSGLYFLSRDFYNLYDGTPMNYLTFVAVHETAHQWWFENVANDQALHPWLDEALCAYSERVFFEDAYPDKVAAWWSYRVDFYQPGGWVDTTVYDGGGFRPYTNAVYFRGAHFLEDLRTRIGDDAFYEFLSDYSSQFAGRIANPADFFALLREHTDVDFSDIVSQYFQKSY